MTAKSCTSIPSQRTAFQVVHLILIQHDCVLGIMINGCCIMMARNYQWQGKNLNRDRDRNAASGSSPPRYRVSDLRNRTSHSTLKTSISYAHSISTFCTFDIVYRYRSCSISKISLSLFDIEGHQPSILNVNNRVTDIEVS